MPAVTRHDPRILESGAGPGTPDAPAYRFGPDGALILRATRIGTTPFCWRRIGTRVHLACQPADLARLDPPAALDTHTLEQLSHWDFPADQRSPFLEVHRVPPAHEVKVASGGQASAARWWTFPAEPAADTPGPDLWEALVAQCADLAAGAERVAVMLSGGVDSAALAAAAAEAARRGGRPAPLLLCARYPGLDCDETGAQEAVARRLGLEVAAVNAAAVPLWPMVEEACRRRNHPLVDGQDGINLALYQAAAREGCAVVLHGIGGDELFEARGLEADLMRRGRIGAAASLIRSAQQARPRPPWPTWLRRGLAFPLWPSRYGIPATEARAAGSWCRATTRRALSQGHLNWRLEMADRTAAECGVRLAMPFFGPGFLDAVAGLPSHRLPAGGVLKGALRKSVRGQLPEAVVRRVRKADFQAYYRHRLGMDGGKMAERYGKLRAGGGPGFLPDRLEPFLERKSLQERFLTGWVALGILVMSQLGPSPGVCHEPDRQS